MRKKLEKIYMALIFILLYAPIVTLVVLSFNASKTRAKWGGFTLYWYRSLFANTEIMNALYDIGFDGIIRPDHGRAIWGEVSMPGYGLYDRALGACYLNGLWEAIVKQNGNAHQE